LGVEGEIMGLVAYKKDFKVNKDFDLAGFIEALDKKNFYPFICISEQISEHKCKLSFEHIKIPMFAPRKENVADEILLSECMVELLKSLGKIRFVASISNSTLAVLVFFIILFMSGAIIMRTIYVWIPIAIFVFFQLLKYYWDVRRYDHIGKIAADF
jgi:hypothetical protein